MDEAEALEELSMLCAATSDPTLTAAEVQQLLDRARRPDADGNAPDDAGWVPTWDMRWAAYRGWLVKAGKAAGYADLASPAGGTAWSRSRIAASCREQANQFKPRRSGAVPLRRS